VIVRALKANRPCHEKRAAIHLSFVIQQQKKEKSFPHVSHAVVPRSSCSLSPNWPPSLLLRLRRLMLLPRPRWQSPQLSRCFPSTCLIPAATIYHELGRWRSSALTAKLAVAPPTPTTVARLPALVATDAPSPARPPSMFICLSGCCCCWPQRVDPN
jgi:hypothetical protein